MPHVRFLCFSARIVIVVDNSVKVLSDDLSNFVKLFKVKLALTNEARKRDRSEITHGDLVRCCVLDNFAAKVGALDGPQVLMVRLGVRMVLVEHVWCACLNLAINNGLPELNSLNGLPTDALGLVLGVEILESFSVALIESFCLVRAEESPVTVISNSLHKQVGNPQSIEEVSGPLFLLTVVFLKLKEFEDVCMPRLKIYGK